MAPSPTAPLEGRPAAGVVVTREECPMTALPPPDEPPLVDVAVLHDLERQMDSRSVVLGFVRDFIQLWEPRYERLAQALALPDPDIALDALLSLKTAAAMAGAVRLSGETERLETAVKQADADRVAGLLPVLARCGGETIQALLELYVMPYSD